MKFEDDILIVDDEIPNLRLLSELLEKEGYQVRPAAKAQTAIESALAKPPGLVLLDVRMPEMDGFEVCRRLKTDERTRDIPIIFVSALQDIEDRVRGFEAGGVDYISKPFQEREVLARVRTHMRLHRMQKHLEQMVDERTAEATESKMRFHSLVENANETIVVTQDEAVKYCNPKITELTGYSQEEMQSRGFDAFIHPGDLERVMREYRARVTGERPTSSYSIRIITKDGQEKHTFVNSALVDWDGKPATLAMLTDITEQERAREELKESEERLSLIYDSVADVLFNIRVEPDDCFRFLSINPSFLKATGLTSDQIVGKRIEEVIPETSIQLVLDNYKKAIKENRIVRWEETSVYPSGEKIGHVSIAPVMNEKGICTHFVGSVHDITERKEAELNYRTVADFTYDWEYWAKMDGTLKYVSPSCERISGYSVQDFMDNPSLLREIVVPEDLIIWDKHFHDSRKDLHGNEVIFRIRRRDGEIRWIEHACQIVTDNIDRPAGFRASNRDITDRKQAEIQLREAYTKIEQLKNQLEAESAHLQNEIKLEHNFENIIGKSEPLKYVLSKVEQVASTDSPVLLMGETG
ncbi:MAG: PAS domain S-box protein, partial [Sedimenticolaceae bacterium]